jgi:uroporphyrinogen decarboxylase
MYREFVIRYYIPVIETAKKYGVQHIVFLTYGNVRPLLDLILEAGFNCLWACETNAPGMDYLDIRKTFGEELGLIGGIDLDALRHGREAIDRELDRKLPVLLSGGNYIPLADGRIRQDVPFENYLYYREKLFNRIKRG